MATDPVEELPEGFTLDTPQSGGLNIAQLEEKYGLPPRLLASVSKAESNDNPMAVGPPTRSGERAQGRFQFMPATARSYNIDPFDEEQAGDAAGQMYQRLLKKYNGDVDKALAAYNWGEGNVDRKGMDAMPKETRDYIKKVKAGMGAQETAADSGLPPGFKLDAPAPTKGGGLYDILSGPNIKSSEIGTSAEGAGMFEFGLNKAKVGAFALPGLPGNLAAGRDALQAALPPEEAALAKQYSALLNPTQVLEQGIIAARKLMGQDAKTALPTSEELATKFLGYDTKMKPKDTTTKVVGEGIEFLTSMIGGPGGPLSALAKKGIGAGTKAFGEAALLSSAVAGGGQLAEEVFGEGEGTKAAGQLAAVVPYSWTAGRIGGLAKFATKEGRAEMRSGVEGKIGPVSKEMDALFQRQAEEQLRSGIKEYPAGVANIKEAVDLQSRINTALKNTDESLSLSAGRASGAPSIVDDELAARRSSNTHVAAAIADDQRNMNALLTYMKEGTDATTTSRKAALDKVIKDYNGKRDALVAEEEVIRQRAERLARTTAPATTAEERGARIVELRAGEKAKEDVVRDRLYGVAKEEANRLGAEFDRSAINAVAERVAKNDLLKYDDTNMPSVIKNIMGAADPAKPLKFDDIAAMKQAVNQDLSIEARSVNPNKRQRIKALTEMSHTIDGAIAESQFPTVAKMFGAANHYYRHTYAPKFNKGINAKLAMTDSFGQQRVLNEKVLDQYAANVNGVKQFNALFKDNPEAKVIMEEHILDRLGKAVTKGGELDPVAYNRWLAKNSDVLGEMEKAGVQSLEQVRSIRGTIKALSDRRMALAADQEKLAKDDLTKLLGTTEHGIIVEKALQSPAAMGRLTAALGEDGSKALAGAVLRDVQRKITYTPESGGIGIDPKAFSKWLTDNEASAKVMFRRAYGPKEGLEHFQRLKDSYRMLEIQQRVPTGAARGQSSIGQDPLGKAVGVTSQTLFSQIRGIIGGRTSTPQAGVALSAQAMTFLAKKTYNDMMAKIATDPQSSKYLLDLVKTDAKKVLTKEDIKKQAKMIANIASTVGHFYVGTAHYLPAMGRLAPAAISGLSEDLNRR